ncbi:precorrin-8X methylmutase [Melghirimyces profundicolus]|uniref:precorrin-8X methylmutase n=1 Tax=Melghirimyces profundicolus TaxID=1242148 RepID=UPI001FE62A75|nr:precorrin-8X methylmutase [Melghirimyces profundicolus]
MGRLQDFQPELDPASIYEQSFSIIDREAGSHSFSPRQWNIVRRIIHATADFDLGMGLLFHPGAVETGIRALREGKRLVTDVNMVKAGVESQLHGPGNRVVCRIRDPEAADLALREGITRSMAAMRLSAADLEGALAVVGNAPTALVELIRLVREEGIRPALIMGLPVGFVSVEESKEELQRMTEVPWITNRGRKGGSSAASAAVNALARMATHSRGEGCGCLPSM